MPSTILRSALLLTLTCLLFPVQLFSQCMTYPVGLDDRVNDASGIVLGRLIEQHGYWDSEHQRIFTLNRIQVDAWLKGHQNTTEIAVITVGGTVGNWAQISHPSLQLHPWNEYVLMISPASPGDLDPITLQNEPALPQFLTVADAQGALTKQQGLFHDLHGPAPLTEAEVFGQIEELTGEKAITPAGDLFSPRKGDTYPLSEWALNQTKAPPPPVTSFAPNPSHAGTIDPADYLTINGSGFGGTAGTVFYSNADDGGATFTASGVASDNLAWSDNQIQNKPAGNAGTGPININGAMTSSSDINVDWAHIEVNSSFAGHSQTERQAYYLPDMNGSGGYTFQYNTSFASNTPAVDAFERALDSWRCETQVNFQISGASTATASVANDGVNVIFFNPSLPAGVLGRANSIITASATGACNQFNTVWWANGIDIEFKNDPPAGCCTWNFGPAASAFLEFDFESVALHELGHAHGLGHVIAPGEVMHFALANGVDTRLLTANDINGGLAKMTFNAIPLCFNPAGVSGNMTPVLPPSCSILAQNELHFEAKREKSGAVQLEWQAIPTSPNHRLFLLRENAEGIFSPIQQFGANAEQAFPVNWKDLQAPTGRSLTYQLILQSADGRVESAALATVGPQTDLSLSIFPNPFQESLSIAGRIEPGAPLNFELIDAQGKRVHQQEYETESPEIDLKIELPKLAPGLYFYRIQQGNMQKRGKLLH